MREILFRAKRLGNGKWVEGFPIFDFADCSLKRNGKCVCEHDGDLLCFYGWIDELHEYDEVEVDPETVCQYTGLTDKDGRKIFEGDICQIHSSSIDEEEGYFGVEWNEEKAGFELCGESLAVDFDCIFGHECEVTGNIFDNPGLLQGEDA